MKEHILAVLALGGQVNFPYIRKWNDGYGEANIRRSDLKKKKQFVIETPYVIKKYSSAKKAAKAYFKLVFTPKNLGLVFKGICRHGLDKEKAYYDMTKEELKPIINRYRQEFFHKDYPFVPTTGETHDTSQKTSTQALRKVEEGGVSGS